MSTESKTPRTDAMSFLIDSIRDEDSVVHSDFARTLELEIGELTAQRDDAVIQALTAKDEIIKERNQLKQEVERLKRLVADYDGDLGASNNRRNRAIACAKELADDLDYYMRMFLGHAPDCDCDKCSSLINFQTMMKEFEK